MRLKARILKKMKRIKQIVLATENVSDTVHDMANNQPELIEGSVPLDKNLFLLLRRRIVHESKGMSCSGANAIGPIIIL